MIQVLCEMGDGRAVRDGNRTHESGIEMTRS